MNSIETLARERGGAIKALSLIGLSANWIGAFAAYPTLFKQYLREHKRNSARVIHPDQGQTGLSKMAGDIYPAFDLLNEIDDDSLSKSMREFTDKFSVPRVEALSYISSLKINLSTLEQQLTDEKTKNENWQKMADRPNDNGISVLLDTLQSQFKQPEDQPDGGKVIHITDLTGKLFYTSTWIVEDEDIPNEVNASLYIMYINCRGSFQKVEIGLKLPKGTSKEVVRERLLDSAKVEIARRVRSLDNDRLDADGDGGQVLGFVNSNIGDGTYSDPPFFPTYMVDEHPDLSKSANSQAFVEGAKNELNPAGVFYAYTPKQLEKLQNAEDTEAMIWLGVVVLDGHVPNEDIVKCRVYYIEGFIPNKKESI